MEATARRIFAKLRLKPGQWRAVAERRFADAECLLQSRNQERANGAIYMAGFVLECLLKALLLERHPNLGTAVDPAKLSNSDREVFESLYRHDLADLVDFIRPELEKKFSQIPLSGGSLWRVFNDVCEEWTVHARYAPFSARLDTATAFLDTVKEVTKWLKEL